MRYGFPTRFRAPRKSAPHSPDSAWPRCERRGLPQHQQEDSAAWEPQLGKSLQNRVAHPLSKSARHSMCYPLYNIGGDPSGVRWSTD